MLSTVRSPGSDGLPRPGDIVCGKYEIEHVLGSGGMGIVFGAKDSSLGRHVAIKFLAPAKASTSGAVARFLREARAAAAIQSEHVVRVFEVGTLPSGGPFIVMEHLRGSDLAHVLVQRGPLPIDEACDFILETCEALAEAHGRGIVHRDLKPQNLFLTQRPDGSTLVKVLDFGISKAADDDAGAGLTATDTVMGTPLYMSPEQVRSLREVDARSDIWSLGSILFELLTAAPIFDAPTASALCAMIAMDAPVPLRSRRAQAPAELEATILRCLHKDPAGRFNDVAALADALVPFASDRGRQSAGRIVRIVRGSILPPGAGATTPHAGLAASYAPTSPMGPNDGRISLPSPSSHPQHLFGGAPGAMTPSMPPSSGPLPTTQSAWDYTGSHRPPSPRREGKIVLAVVAVAGAVLVLGLIGGGIAFYKRNELAAAIAPSDGPPPERSAPPATPPPATPPPVATPVPVPAPAPAPTPTPTGKPLSARDETLARQAEQLCEHHTTILQAARDDASRARAAQNAKTLTCTKGAQASRCERQVCITACTVLNDRPCLDRMNAIINRGPAPRF